MALIFTSMSIYVEFFPSLSYAFIEIKLHPGSICSNNKQFTQW